VVRFSTGQYPSVSPPPSVPPHTTRQVPVTPPAVPAPATGQTPPAKTGQFPAVKTTGQYPAVGGLRPPTPPPKAPSQTTRANPIVPGAAAARGDVSVEAMSGPFPVAERPTPRSEDRPAALPRPPAPPRPPPGMSDADVNALYAKYVQAKQMVGEAMGPREREKLLKTINAQAPKIMEQYKAKGVDFSVVVKDNQVIIRAKPKT
jgi:hypothetical protein